VFWLDLFLIVTAVYVAASLIGICVSARAAHRVLVERNATIAPVMEVEVFTPTDAALPSTGR
jgi:hypothetical protein